MVKKEVLSESLTCFVTMQALFELAKCCKDSHQTITVALWREHIEECVEDYERMADIYP